MAVTSAALAITIGIFGAPAAGSSGVTGAIYTTIADGTTVNGNIYASKDAVYLNGGPQNNHAAGLPDGLYYFQVTDPSGAVLLSEDPIECRVVSVVAGRMAGAPPIAEGDTGPCVHANGALDLANGTLPVQLVPYLDTPNHGGEYKAWLTPVATYGAACAASAFGFCPADSKTDNFKVRSVDAAYVTVCKFNDIDGDGVQGANEPLIPHWPITATGVNEGPAAVQTDDSGCVSFTFSGFTADERTRTITLAEGTVGTDWVQTAPASCEGLPGCDVENGIVTVVVAPGDHVEAPRFGNHNPYCGEGCPADGLVATSRAFTSLTRSYTWQVTKDVDRARIESASPVVNPSYTVTVTHDAGTDSGWKASGTIRVSNPGVSPVTAVAIVLSTDNGGACAVADGAPTTVDAGTHEDVAFECLYTAVPTPGVATAAITWAGGAGSAVAVVDFAGATIETRDDQVTIDDSLAGSFGALTVSDPSPAIFSYVQRLIGEAGRCTVVENIATVTMNTSAAELSASRSVEICVGTDLVVATTAAGIFDSAIQKRVDRARVEQADGSATFTYTVDVTETGWTVSGTISLTNPNTWEAIAATVADAADAGGACTIDGGASVVVPAAETVVLPFRCTWVAAPDSASGQHAVTVTWDAAAAFTPGAGATATAGFTFAPLLVTDTFDGTVSTLGTIATPAALTTFTYTQTVANAPAGTCQAHTNVASIAQTGQKASQVVHACNTNTGALTIGFWQNKNGQGVISTSAAGGGVCAVNTWLRQFTPFQDLAPGSCTATATWVYGIIKAANASGASMNAMLKAQMLATALDVYFSDPALGGNRINARVAIGGVRVDLTQVCRMLASTGGTSTCSGMPVNASPAFGGAASMPVSDLLAFQNTAATAGGSSWYAQVKSVQELAKNVFDAINNRAAYVAP